MSDNHSESDGIDEMRHLPPEVSDETAPYQVPDLTVRVLQRENVDVCIFPAMDGDGYQFMIAHPYEFGTGLAGLLDEEMFPVADSIGLHPDWGAYQIFSLAEVLEIRDGYECMRDRIRHGERRPQPIDPDPDALQEMIDALVIVEWAVEHIHSRDEDERVRHYHRMSALGEDPEEVITTVQQAIEPGGGAQPNHLTDGLRDAARRFFSAREDQDR